MADTHAHVDFALSKRSYYADFLLVPPATLIAIVWLFTNHTPVRLDVFVSSVLTGALAWSFAEYAIHRWVFHGKSLWLRQQHGYHHMRPAALIGVSSVATTIFGALTFWALTMVFGPVIGVGLLVGFVLGYLAYIVAHDRFHHGAENAGSMMATLNRNHDFHHRHFRMNFGVTSPLWDMIFGTYQRPPR